MDDASRNAIEVIANILYLIERCADDAACVRDLTSTAKPSMAVLVNEILSSETTSGRSPDSLSSSQPKAK